MQHNDCLFKYAGKTMRKRLIKQFRWGDSQRKSEVIFYLEVY